jgi:hypothetical protein
MKLYAPFSTLPGCFQVFHENAPITEPIAWFQGAGPSGPAHLSLTADADAMRDEVLAALIVLDQDLRDGHKAWDAAGRVGKVDSGFNAGGLT